jgi:hypothetical protein
VTLVLEHIKSNHYHNCNRWCQCPACVATRIWVLSDDHDPEAQVPDCQCIHLDDTPDTWVEFVRTHLRAGDEESPSIDQGPTGLQVRNQENR